MPKTLDILSALCAQTGYWAERVTSQLKYAAELSKTKGGMYDGAIAEAVAHLNQLVARDGVISKDSALETEGMLAKELSAPAKALSVVCASHAHIDMNWMWGYPETAAVTLDTFRTMLLLMDEYPDFKFSQSQASVYKIVEDYDPEMLDEIRARVREGRWEVTASTWVEADKNMPNGESFARHALYTKRYLSKLLGIAPESMCIDYEPDTFGHSANIPEVLSKAGVKYYYHIRGLESPLPRAYRWRAPSGAEVIAYHDVQGYGATISPEFVMLVPEFCAGSGLDTMLKVYGVGDHGGGPTRRDLERIIDMNTWPVFPNLRFGTYAEFYGIAAASADRLPLIVGENNFVFTGCYTTQTRIKLSNRYGEARLYDAEALSAFASLRAGVRYPGGLYEDSWRKVLFNQFHDIITGSGVIETREYALGQFQQVLTATNTSQAKAMRAIAARIDTSALAEEDIITGVDTSEGAGVGFGATDYALPQAERGRGKRRVLHFFNSTAYPRCETAEAVIWDWPGELDRLEVRDSAGGVAQHQILGGKAQLFHPEGAFWGHRYFKLLVKAEVPAYGYATYTLDETTKTDFKPTLPGYERVELPDGYVLENDKAIIRFDTRTAAILSWIDKATGEELIDPDRPSGMFRLIDEDTAKGMTSWTIGRYMNVTGLNESENTKVTDYRAGDGLLRQWISYTIAFRSSQLKVKLSLDAGSAGLRFDVEWDWYERWVRNIVMPQLNFYMPFKHDAKTYRYDVPFGTQVREDADMDLPGNSFACAVTQGESAKGFAIISDNKYGFRGFDNAVGVTLTRSSYDPDPLPESGLGKTSLLVVPSDGQDPAELIDASKRFCHAVTYISGTRHSGTQPLSGGFMSLEGRGVAVSAVKKPEDGAAGCVIVRLYEYEGKDTSAALTFDGPVVGARLLDLNEREIAGDVRVQGSRVSADIGANQVVSLLVEVGI